MKKKGKKVNQPNHLAFSFTVTFSFSSTFSFSLKLKTGISSRIFEMVVSMYSWSSTLRSAFCYFIIWPSLLPTAFAPAGGVGVTTAALRTAASPARALATFPLVRQSLLAPPGTRPIHGLGGLANQKIERTLVGNRQAVQNGITHIHASGGSRAARGLVAAGPKRVGMAPSRTSRPGGGCRCA